METITIISIIVAIICFFITLNVGLTTDLLREVKTVSPAPPAPPAPPVPPVPPVIPNPPDFKTPYSFSRVQFWLWTLIICPAFVLNWGFHYLLPPNFDEATYHPYLNETSLILLGISVSVSFGAGVIKAAQNDARNKLGGLYSLKGDRESQGFWTDILTDEEGQFSIGRLQNLLFTMVYLMIYIIMFFHDDKVYPDFDPKAYMLMGISSGGYLLAKGNKK